MSSVSNIDVQRTKLKTNLIRMGLGGMACMTAATITHPIDTIKIRLQIQGELGSHQTQAYNNLFKAAFLITKNEGLRGLYKGITASWIREGVYSSLRLGLYEPFKDMLGETDPKNTPIWIKFTAGSLSGFVGSLVGNPTDMLKVRMQAWEGQPQHLTWHARTVYTNFGLIGFYKGIEANVLRATILNACQLGTYDTIKHTILNSGILKDGKMCHFASSICAGIVMAVCTSPVDIIKTRLMNQSTGNRTYNGFIDCGSKIYNHEGLSGFYKGFTAQWARMGPFTIIQLMVWERLRQFFGIKAI